VILSVCKYFAVNFHGNGTVAGNLFERQCSNPRDDTLAQQELPCFLVRLYDACRSEAHVDYVVDIVMSHIAQVVGTLHGLLHIVRLLLRYKPQNVTVIFFSLFLFAQ